MMVQISITKSEDVRHLLHGVKLQLIDRFVDHQVYALS